MKKSTLGKAVLWTMWAAIPVAALAFHLGPGQKLDQKDTAASHISAAERAAASENWQLALDEYAKARAALPEENAKERDMIEFAEAKTQLDAGAFLEASDQLEALLNKEEAKASPDQNFVHQIREQIGQTAYYTGWVMRIEGASPEEWREETTRARQQFRYLAETVTETAFKKTSTDNLEAVIRLEQMDDSELLAQKRPKNCDGANCSQKKRGQKLSKTPGKKPSDARDQIKKETSSNAVSSGKGS